MMGWRSIVCSILYHAGLYIRRVWILGSTSMVVSKACHTIDAYKGTYFQDTSRRKRTTITRNCTSILDAQHKLVEIDWYSEG